MDETGTSPTETTPARSPEELSAEAARTWAEQQRAQARAQFQTPSWLGPTRDGATAPAVPVQAEPEHDELPVVEPAVPREPIPDAAHWTERARPRVIAGTVLALALVGVAAFLAAAIATQSVGAIVGLVTCAFVAVVFRGALMGAGVTTVDLKGSSLRIRRNGTVDEFNLADPAYAVDLVGTPDQSSWQLRLERIDGRIVTLGPREVDAPELHRVVEYYRSMANRAKFERERRFNR